MEIPGRFIRLLGTTFPISSLKKYFGIKMNFLVILGKDK